MQSKAKTVDQYIDELPDDRKHAISELRKVILKNLPKGFEETMSYGMIGYVVPLSLYPAGYHCDPSLPLPYMNVASQKNFIAVYHMGIYGSKKLLEWFTNEYSKVSKTKLDMGKSCIRFKKMDQIPYQLIGELSGKISAEDWMRICEGFVKK
jgi:uncharacterized protein YdhG (YjbR/CyaY superfamily)